MVTISVVVPVYNSEKKLPQCLNSILQQSLTELEVILVNDGSTDGSGEICRSYAQKDNRVKVIEQENKGVSAARNKGVEEAVGTYLVFIDSDDYIPQDYLEKMYQGQKKYGDTHFVVSGMQIISPNQTVPEQKLCYGAGEEEILGKKDIIKLLDASLLNSPCNKLYLLAELKNNAIRMKEDISIAEDLLFNIQYFEQAAFQEILVLNTNLYQYVRDGGESLDNKYYESYYEIHAFVFRELKNYGTGLHISDEDQRKLLVRYWQIMERTLKNTFQPENKAKWWQKYRQNDIIIRNAMFQDALEAERKQLSRGRYWAYKSGCYVLVQLYNVWSRVRNHHGK